MSSHELELPWFVIEAQDEEGNWGPTCLGTPDENEAWAMIEGVPGERIVRVESWRGRVVAVSDREGLVEPVG